MMDSFLFVVGVTGVVILIAAPILIRYGINHYFNRKREFLDGLGMTRGDRNGA